MRVVSAAFQNELEASRSGEVPVIFATITAAGLTPVHVCSDLVNYVYQGDTYFGWAFNIKLVSDDENPPKGQISIQNVDSAIAEFILAIQSKLRLNIKIFAKSEFTDDNPRVAIGTPTIQYEAPDLFLSNITVDTVQVSADITSFDLASEPFPHHRATIDKTPGVFR